MRATQACAFLTKASSTGRRESGTLTLTQQVTVSTILASLLSSVRSSVERFSLTFPCFETCFPRLRPRWAARGWSLVANPTRSISFPLATDMNLSAVVGTLRSRSASPYSHRFGSFHRGQHLVPSGLAVFLLCSLDNDASHPPYFRLFFAFGQERQ